MYETDSNISLRDDLLAGNYDDLYWSVSDDLDLFEQDYILLDKGELLSYTIGAVVAAAIVLKGHLVLDYPPSFPLALMGDVTAVDGVAVFSVICLITFVLNLLATVSALREATAWDGAFSSYAAIGFYLFPQITVHWPFLVMSVAVGVGLTVGNYRHKWSSTPLAKIAWSAAANTAAVSFLVICLGGLGLVPMAASNPSSTEGNPQSSEVLADLFSRVSLDDMSYQEIADMLQVVAHVESERLGLQNHEPRVRVGYTGSAAANYNSRFNAITLNASILSQPQGVSGYDAVESVTHEMAHAYENAVANGTITSRWNSPLGNLGPDDIARWREELSSNVDMNRHFTTYWYQDIEVRARNYADDEMPHLLAMASDAS